VPADGVLLFPSAMINEPILLPVAPHSVDSEFLPLVDTYRGIVEESVFDFLGRPSFFDETVEVVMGRVAETLKHLHPDTPVEEKVRLTIRLEAKALAHAIECRFVRTGKIKLPEGQIEAPAKSTS
jgi:hypothetical protein